VVNRSHFLLIFNGTRAASESGKQRHHQRRKGARSSRVLARQRRAPNFLFSDFLFSDNAAPATHGRQAIAPPG
jgi:hypothetical protein